MPPNRDSDQSTARERDALERRVARRGGSGAHTPALVGAVQDAQRKRRRKRPLRRIAAIVPVSDYRDVVG